MNIFKKIKNLLCDCPLPTKKFEVPAFTLYIADFDVVQEERKKYMPKYNKPVNGFCILEDKTIWVAYSGKTDKNGWHLPMLETVGHEVIYHIIEGGLEHN